MSNVKRGDYIKTEGMTAEQYNAVADKFLEMGAEGDHRHPVRIGRKNYLMWDDENDIDVGPLLFRCSGREVSLADVLGQFEGDKALAESDAVT